MKDNTRQYTAAYGPFKPGQYQIGQQVSSQVGDGEIIWSFLQGKQGLTYVVVGDDSFPFEVLSREITGRK